MTKLTKANEEATEVVVHQGYGEYTETGFEEVKSSDLVLPYISLVQAGTPELQDKKIPGIEVGDLLNTVTGQLVKGNEGLNFIPCYLQESWVEWTPRTKGGGIVAQHEPDSDIVKLVISKNGGSKIPPKNEEGKRVSFKTPQKNELVETYYLYVLLLDDSGLQSNGFAVITFSGTKISTYKKFITTMMTVKTEHGKPPIFGFTAKLKSQEQKNDYGKFANYLITPLKETWMESILKPNDPLIKEAFEFRKMITEGKAKIDLSNVQNDSDIAHKDDDAF